mmetsp:Transcript_26174/g.80515  ORF Transcript_26174/g.80515 Transcript_26174/m.80515 type:complete len:654 (-) Transcript_26174:410-2371(-)
MDEQEGPWEDLFGDGTLLKQLVKEGAELKGEAQQRPKRGDKVKVHYKGTLSETGTQFDNSRDRGKPFEFNVGVGVIEGWSEAVPTMRCGEVSKFRICAAKAYGQNGQPPQIPANASLDFEIELLSFTDREDITGDGSVTKKVLKEGNRWQRPNKNCDVRLEAKKCGQDTCVEGWWPSSRRFEPLRLSEDLLLPAKLRTAVETMKADERSNVRLFGHDEYELFVKAWVENEQCVDKKPNAVIKRIEVKAPKGDEDWKTPNDTEKIAVSGVLYRADDDAKKPFLEFAEASWYLDEHSGYATMSSSETETDTNDEDEHLLRSASRQTRVPLCEGLECGLRKMKVGETAVVKIRDDYGFQQAALDRLYDDTIKSDEKSDEKSDATLAPFVVPKNALPVKVALEARVTLLKVEENKPYWEMDGEEKIKAIEEKRLLGNAHFARGDFDRAIRRYSRAIDTGASTFDMPDELKPQIVHAARAAKLNRAACHLKNRDYADARVDCTDVLNQEPTNAKALFRRAKALTAMDEWTLAKADLKLMLEHDPANLDAKRALADVTKKVHAHKAELKRLYAGRSLFSKHDVRDAAAAKVPEGQAYPFPQGEPPVTMPDDPYDADDDPVEGPRVPEAPTVADLQAAAPPADMDLEQGGSTTDEPRPEQ